MLRFVIFGGHQGRDSTMGASIPICGNGAFKPALVRLIRGKTELLLGAGIIRKLDITVRYGGDQFKVGQIECGMVTFNEKNHVVFPLVPTSRAYAKLNGNSRKLRNSKIGDLSDARRFWREITSSESFTTEKPTVAK